MPSILLFGPNMLLSTDQAASLVGLGEINAFVHMMILNNSHTISIVSPITTVWCYLFIMVVHMLAYFEQNFL